MGRRRRDPADKKPLVEASHALRIATLKDAGLLTGVLDHWMTFASHDVK